MPLHISMHHACDAADVADDDDDGCGDTNMKGGREGGTRCDAERERERENNRVKGR